MVTIRDIAQRLGIAVSTVSKGLNGAPDVSAETRQLVLDTAVEMGYAAKRARRQAQPKVCVLVENMEYANIGQFGYEIVAGFRLAAAARGWAVDVLPTTPEAQARTKYGSLLLEGGYGGAFILGLTPQDAYMRALAGTGTPTVLLDNCVPNASVGYVGTDSWEGVELGVRHLAGLGHRKIAFLNGTRDSMVSEERRLAFLHATWLCGLSADERMMAYGYYEQNCAREYVPHFLAQGATAILCASDGIARGVLAELRRLGLRVPGDVSVMGHDDLPLAAGCEPPLTTIRQDRLALGKSAFSLLDSLMNGVAVSKVLLRPQLIVRESTGPAPVRK